MLPRTTTNIEKPVVRWVDGSQQLGDLCALSRIVLEARVDDVVKLGGFSKHARIAANEMRLSCGAQKRDSFHNRRAPPASSACRRRRQRCSSIGGTSSASEP